MNDKASHETTTDVHVDEIQESPADVTSVATFPVVALGSSAGGLQALRQFFYSIPADTGMAFIIISHLDPDYESQLHLLLSPCTIMQVHIIEDGIQVEPNHVYVITPDSDILLEQDTLRLKPRSKIHGLHLPVNYFMESLARSHQQLAIGVILSGTGSDGTQGLAEIKGAGGVTFAQDLESAKYDGMPQNAISSGCVDFVLPPEEIAKQLTRIGTHPYLAHTQTPPVELDAIGSRPLSRILSLLCSAFGVDFNQYRGTTVMRRIDRRMALSQRTSLKEYSELLEKDSNELEALYQDILINVTSFFRDPEMYEMLQKHIFPRILTHKALEKPIRLWVAGCSTGQEAYSLAIALTEFLEDKPHPPEVQIFATDLSQSVSLTRARQAHYPLSIEAEVSPMRLRRFFRKEDGGYRVIKPIRDMCVFARQNLASDPPFSSLDLISCRNVLIYLSPQLQKRIIPIFHYALNPVGFLILGSSEAIGKYSNIFEQVQKEHNIYAKHAVPERSYPHFSAGQVTQRPTLTLPESPTRSFGTADWEKEADRIVVGEYGPVGVLVNDHLEVIQFRGRTSLYLEPPNGKASYNLLSMAKEGLFGELRSGVSEAKEKKEMVTRTGIKIRSDAEHRTVNLKIIPLRLSGYTQICFLILFEEPGQQESGALSHVPGPIIPGWRKLMTRLTGTKEPKQTSETRELQQIRHELIEAREYQQALLEDQEAANEELRSANEEILSSNEELQSTNEELETAKEELQSMNEELSTVNDQLQIRNIDMGTLNDDLHNFINSTQFPMLILSSKLAIRRFTARAEKILNLNAADIGRSIDNIKLGILIPNMIQVITEVIETVQSHKVEVQDASGFWYLLCVHPYRTTDNKIDGVVIVLIEIDELKRSQEKLKEADRRKDEFLAMLAHELRNPLAAITNAVYLIGITSDESKTREGREVIARQTHRLVEMIEDLLDVSRITRGKIVLRNKTLDASKVIDHTIETVLPHIEDRRQILKVESFERPILMSGDPSRLEQVFVNLLSNASKYTPVEGRIRVAVKRSDGMMEVSISDNGVGIAADQLPRVFDLFLQGVQSADRDNAGLGIGLTLAKSIVEMHGGIVKVQSEGLGRGSEFIVLLPLLERAEHLDAYPADEEKSLQGSANKKARKYRILIIEDHEDIATQLARYLEVYGHQVVTASSGEHARTIKADLDPQIILLDIGLPGLDGFEIAQELRQKQDKDQLLIIAISGYSSEANRIHSHRVGIDHYLAKPVDPQEVIRIIREYDIEE